MKIAGIDTRDTPLVVAEIGNNHEGNYAVARKLVEAAATAGVHAVKFQTFNTDFYVTRADEARHRRLKSFELTIDQFEELAALAHECGLLFVSTPFDLASASGLARFVDAFKIASGDVDFFPLIDRVLGYGKPLIISTGASDLDKVAATVRFAKDRLGSRMQDDLALLHCVAAYPAPAAEVNLRAMALLKERFGVSVGFSDHTMGIDAATLAIAAGAEIIEKHFTLDKNYSEFRDHQLSADPQELALLVERIGAARTLMGTATKAVQPSEQASVMLIRRAIVAARELPAGATIRREDLTWVRPRAGLAPGAEHQLVNRRLRRAKAFGEPITGEDCE
jgi:sialic acid synthase SpsE